MSHQIENFNKEIDAIFFNGNSGVRSTMTEIKKSLEGLKACTCRLAEE